MFTHRDSTMPEMSRRTVLETAPGHCGAELQLVHRTAGWECAGAGTRDASEAWGALYIARDGTRGGQWFLSEDEARNRFERLQGLNDGRYSIALEYAGQETAVYVLRFCDEFVQSFPVRSDAENAQMDHWRARRLEMESGR